MFLVSNFAYFKGFLFIFQLLKRFLGVPNAFQTISSRKFIYRFFRTILDFLDFPLNYFYDLLLQGSLPPPINPLAPILHSPQVLHCCELLAMRNKEKVGFPMERCRATKSDFRFWYLYREMLTMNVEKNKTSPFHPPSYMHLHTTTEVT